MQTVHLAQSRPGVAFRNLAHAVPGVLHKLIIVNQNGAEGQTEIDVELVHKGLHILHRQHLAATGEVHIAAAVDVAGLGIGALHPFSLPLIDHRAEVPETVEITGGGHHSVDSFPAGMKLGVSYHYCPLETLADKPLFNTVLEGLRFCQKTRDSEAQHIAGLNDQIAAQQQAIAALQQQISELHQVMAEALKTAECNACMKRIVAAPTAGSCGVLPAVLLPLWRSGSYNEEAICRALYVSAGFGQVVAARATLAGAEGGCQAEVGAASAMAAAALVELRGGTAEQCAEAFAMALTNLEGLVCDPVAGLVEIPCIKRNVIGAMNAVSCADMALAGVVGHIPADEVIDAMAEVGAAMSNDLRETGIGGLAGGDMICRSMRTQSGG